MYDIFVKNTTARFIFKGNSYEIRNDSLLTMSKYYIKIVEKEDKIVFSFTEVLEGKVVKKIHKEYPDYFMFGPNGDFLFQEKDKLDFLIQLCFRLEGINLYKNERGWVVA